MKKLLLILFINIQIANAQCLTDSLIINTGYDPVGDSAVTPGYDWMTPVPDPKWLITALSPAADSAINAMGGLTAVTPGNPADVINSIPTWTVNPPGNPGNWINCFNYSQYNDTGTAAYYMTLTRPFTLCKADTLFLNFNILADNYIAVANIDDSIKLNMVQPDTNNPVLYNTFTYDTQTVVLTEGLHKINFMVVNYTIDVSLNPTGFDLYGTISSVAGKKTICAENDTTCINNSCSNEGVSKIIRSSLPEIFPNPVNDQLHLNGLTQDAVYSIFDIAGKLLLSGVLHFGDNVVNANVLSNGMYFIEISPTGTVMQSSMNKFMVLH